MWLVSCRKQWILTQGTTHNPNCYLNISSFTTLPHFLDCLICTRNTMSIVLLLQLGGKGEERGEGGGGGGIVGIRFI